MIGTLCMDLVVQDLPRISQFLVMMLFRPLKPGLYVVTKMLGTPSSLFETSGSKRMIFLMPYRRH